MIANCAKTVRCWRRLARTAVGIRVFGCIVLLALAPASLVIAAWHGTLVLHAAPIVSPALDLIFAASPLAWPFFLSIALVVPAVALWTLARGRAHDGYLLSVFVASMLLVLIARSVASFALAWEIMAVVSALLVAAHHEHRYVRRAVLSYLVVSQVGTLCIVATLVILAVHAGNWSFADIQSAAGTLPGPVRLIALSLALVGFGSKAGLVPLHFWLPRAHPAAPGNASAMLSGLMLAVAIYGLIQTFVILAAPAPQVFSLVVIALGLVTAVVGGLYASVDTDVKRLLAYSSIENIGIIVATLGLAMLASGLGEGALAALALVALLFHAISHAVFKSLLFLAAGTVSQSVGTTDLEHLGGLFRTLRFTALLVFLGCMAASALPSTVGFASEWLVLQVFIHALLSGPILLRATAAVSLAALAMGAGLATSAYVKMYGIGFLGVRRSAHRALFERFDFSVAGLTWLALAIVVLGTMPGLVLGPLAGIVNTVAIPAPPAIMLAVLPCVGLIAALLYYAGRRARRVETWSCASPMPRRGQYTASAFQNPIAIIFKALLRPERERTYETAESPWFPRRITYATNIRHVVDEMARWIAAVVQQFGRRTRIVQGGNLRIYLAYAVVALIVVLVVAK